MTSQCSCMRCSSIRSHNTIRRTFFFIFFITRMNSITSLNQITTTLKESTEKRYEVNKKTNTRKTLFTNKLSEQSTKREQC
ncbi:unnamed protein product [Schistosoma curassoni]|uniref:Secreted protein n=1 Tax=Schistosoma curassoni TaxID=6186 RepID=A0A183KVH9_9TREM|nr:unnamed protein product [Schistosoma curassoni]